MKITVKNMHSGFTQVVEQEKFDSWTPELKKRFQIVDSAVPSPTKEVMEVKNNMEEQSTDSQDGN